MLDAFYTSPEHNTSPSELSKLLFFVHTPHQETPSHNLPAYPSPLHKMLNLIRARIPVSCALHIRSNAQALTVSRRHIAVARHFRHRRDVARRICLLPMAAAEVRPLKPLSLAANSPNDIVSQ